MITVGSLLWWLIVGGQLMFIGVSPEALEPANEPVASPTRPSLLALVAAYVATAFMALTSLFVLVTLPYWLGKLGSRILKKMIRLCQIAVTPSTLLTGKILVCSFATVPALLYVVYDINALYLAVVSIIISVIAIIIFILQHSIAKMSHFEAKDIW